MNKTKEYKNKQDLKSLVLKLRLNHREHSVLLQMMEKEEWENKSGFVKNKLFGDSVDTKYEKMLKAEKKESVEKILQSSFYDLTEKINGTLFCFNYNMEQFDKRLGESKMDKRLAEDFSSTLKKWIRVAEAKFNEYISDAELILRNMDIIVERAKAKNDLTMLPDYVVFKALKGDDFNSPIAQEGARRLFIGHEMDNEELERRRIAREAKEKEEAEKARNEKEKKQS